MREKLSKNLKTIFLSFLLLYGLMAYITWWTYSPNFGKFTVEMVWPTIMLFTAYSVLGSASFKHRKDVDSLSKEELRRKLTKYASICLGFPFVMIGIVFFLIWLVEKNTFSGLLALIVSWIVSVPFFMLPWGIYYLMTDIRKK